MVHIASANTELASFLVEFDLDSILEYANAASRSEEKENISPKARHEKPQSDSPRSPELFTILNRKWVSEMESPVPLKARMLAHFVGGGVTKESSKCFRISIEDFEFKSMNVGEPSLTISKKQKGQIKKGTMLSMHVLDPDDEAEISAEINFITSRLKKCKAHFVVSNMMLEIDLLPASKKVVVSVSYKVDIVTSFYRYFSSDISQALDLLLRPQIEKYSVEGEEFYSGFESLSKDNHLFYKVITENTDRMPSVSQSFHHPSLQTRLLPFQQKSVRWLLSKENVVYDDKTYQCTHSPIVGPELYQGLVSFPRIDRDWLAHEISNVLSKLCFGWKRVRYSGQFCWYNRYTGNIMSERQVVSFLQNFYKESNKDTVPGCGLLSEEMGLGKTVEITTLIQLNSRPANEVGASISLQFKDGGDFKLVKKAKTTLIAAPESIIRQWYTEICQICPSLSVTIYKGLGKYPELSNIPQYIAEFLQSYDVVLLNYSTLAKETDYANYSSRHKPTRGGQKRTSDELDEELGNKRPNKRAIDSMTPEVESFKADFHIPDFTNQDQVLLSQKKFERTVVTELAKKIARRDLSSISHTEYYESPLMSCQWWRVVLDEVQMVSSGSTRAFTTAALLPRFHSWGVSGTPSTSPAVLQFLRFSPFNYDIQKYCWKLLTAPETGNENFVELWSSLAIRHTKNMVYDDIKLPPQQRVLLTLPFTDVEQDKYKEILESTLAYIGINDIKAATEKKLALESSSYSHLRTWLLRLRQICGNLQVGRLPKPQTIKGKNKTRILVSGVKELKTLGNVLVDMIESVDDDVSESEKSFVNRVLELCQALEYVFYPEKVIEILNMLLLKLQDLIENASNKTDLDKVKFKKLRITLHKKDALPRDNNAYVSDSDEDLDMPQEPSQDGNATVKIEAEDTVIDDEEIWENLAEFKKLKERISADQLKLRSWRIIEHKCFFLLASAHFQLYDSEYQDKIAKLKVSFDAVNQAVETVKKLGFFSKEILSNSEVKHDQSLPNEIELDAEEKNKSLEKQFYELAEECRKNILKHSIDDVEHVTSKRIRTKVMSSVDTLVNDGRKAFPKSTKKLFTVIPQIKIAGLSKSVSNMKCRSLVKQFQALATKLNQQAELINDFMGQLLAVLTNPLTSNDRDADGAEFEQSVQDQERASCLMLVISQMLIDRSSTVLDSKATITEIERQQENEFRQEVQRISDRKFLKQLQESRISVKPIFEISMEELAEDAKILDLELKSGKTAADHDLSADTLAALKLIFENEKTGQNLLKKELNSTFNIVFNSRVEYFRQLQQISDSVQNDSFKFPQDKADADTLETLFQNLYRNLETSQNKLTRYITRSRYLATLLPGAKAESQADNDREEIICIICQSAITVGSLTFCGHKFCKDCLEEWLKRSPHCPMCKADTDATTVYGFTQYNGSLKAQHLDVGHSHTDGIHQDEKSAVNQIYKQIDEETLRKVERMHLVNSYGSKVDLIVKQVLYLRSQDPNVQIVIFSQWHDLLVILAFAFDKMNISYVSAKDSHITASKKTTIDPVEAFKDQSNIKTCFLLNSQAQSSGLTLINATHIFLCEPLINTSTELQAISRIHRIGQKKLTTVWMFAIDNSVEENIVALGTKRRIEYFKANAKENGKVSNQKPKKSTLVLEDTEIREAESFALTLSPTTGGKKTSETTEFVDDADLYNIYFGIKST
ncbi:hypothetical protein JCM33374_g3883 [Metschnikowia sp. JCM 33374]|nr:hypothetical protein JCM33374_g3883 [Metschnikowia sp. JCM 33374]